MKKYLNELSIEELEKVYHANKELREKIYEDMIDSEMYWINNYLSCFKDSLLDWSVGVNGNNYIIVNDNKYFQFIEGVKKLQSSYYFLHDKEDTYIESIGNKLERLSELNMYSNDYNKLEKELQNDIKKLTNKIVKQFNENFNSLLETEHQINYFIEFYADERLSECYIKANENDYVLYEEVSYVKSYAS